MNNLIRKPKIETLALILLLTLSAILVTVSTAAAQEYDAERVTFAYIGATPNPVGVNQEVLLHVGITDYLLVAEDGWEGITVTVTKPDGNTDTLGPYRTDSTGGTGAIFVPTMVGTYYLQTHFPEQSYNWVSPPPFNPALRGLILYEASESDVLELVVQENPIEYYPAHSLPSEYWTRPIDAQLREWKTISGSWLAGASRGGVIAPYNDGPETAHILWTTELTMGGLVGGDLGEHGMVCGDAYEGKFQGSLIINGIFYYNKFEAQGGSDVEQVVVAVDLHTGEELWARTLLNNEQIDFGQTMYWSTMNSHGVYAYLWATSGTTWMAFDAQTGRWVYNMTGVPRGTRVYGPNGELLIYNADLTAGTLMKWNSTAVYYNTLLNETDNYHYYAGRWRPQGRTFDASFGTETFTIPTGLPGSVRAYYPEDRILGVGITGAAVSSWAVSLEPGKVGNMLFSNSWVPPAEWGANNMDVTFAIGSPEDNTFALWVKETRKYYGFNINTGAFLWETDSEHYMDSYVGTNRVMAYGKLYSVGYAGIVYCYNLATGNTEWTYLADDKYNEILWSNGWPLRIQFVTDGKLYIGMEEHSSVDPKPRGAPYFCLDANSGAEVWRINGGIRQTHWGGNSIIGDGIIAAMNTYDQRIYAVGKGPSELTASASPKVAAKGSLVLVEGTVMDVSPGTASADLTLRFPNGVPAVSDASMSEWMLYVYMQFERPADTTGVTVKLEAVDPSGGYKYLGTTITDSYGNYGFAFEPETEGTYMIIASFEGSGAYYGSTTTTYITVGPASSPSTPIEPEAPFITTEVAIILAVVAVAAIGVVGFLVIRKRK